MGHYISAGTDKKNMEGWLGLNDSYTLNQAVGEKLWWGWPGGGRDLWKQIWTRKYNMQEITQEIL